MMDFHRLCEQHAVEVYSFALYLSGGRTLADDLNVGNIRPRMDSEWKDSGTIVESIPVSWFQFIARHTAASAAPHRIERALLDPPVRADRRSRKPPSCNSFWK